MDINKWITIEGDKVLIKGESDAVYKILSALKHKKNVMVKTVSGWENITKDIK